MKMFTFHKRLNVRDEVESYGFTRSFGSRYAHELRNEMRGSPVSSLGAFRLKNWYNERHRREK